MSGSGHLFVRSIHLLRKPSLVSPSPLFPSLGSPSPLFPSLVFHSPLSPSPGIPTRLLPPRLQTCQVVLSANSLRTLKLQRKETPRWWHNASDRFYKTLTTKEKTIYSFIQYWQTLYNKTFKKVPSDKRVLGNVNQKRTFHRTRVNFNIDDPEPKQVTALVQTLQSMVKFTPESISRQSITDAACYFGYWFDKHKVTLPLNGRQATHILTTEEALLQANLLLIQDKLRFKIATERNDTGEATDATTARAERIMKTLIDANPELQKTEPGVAFRAHVVDDLEETRALESTIDNVMVAYPTGDIVMSKAHLDNLDDDEAAFIMAHEMTHVIQQHYIETNSLEISFFYFFAKMFKPVAYADDFDLRAVIKQFKSYVTLTDEYCQELEADQYGHQFACKACYDYRSFQQALTKILKLIEKHHNYVYTPPASPPSAPASPEEAPPTSNLRWNERVMEELRINGLTFYQRHPRLNDRKRKLRSIAWIEKAIEYRREAGCEPASLQ